MNFMDVHSVALNGESMGEAHATPRLATKSPCDTDSFRHLVNEKKSFIGKLLFFSLGFILLVMVMAGFAKPFMTTNLIGSFNIGYALIVAIYIVCWVAAVIYVNASNGKFDQLTDEVVREHNQGKNL
jgi:uncharacterized membrane protein (DUF485 family)